MLHKIWGSEKGISLIEIVLAVALLGVAVAGLVAALATGLRVSQVVEEQSVSATLLTSQVEDILWRSCDDVSVITTTVPGSDGLSLSLINATTTCPRLQEITVTASIGDGEVLSATTFRANTEPVPDD